QLHDALLTYRTHFKPSAFLTSPYSMACVNAIAADTDDEAEYLATSFYQLALGMFRNARRPLQPPVASMEDIWMPDEERGVMQMATYAFFGSSETIAKSFQAFIDKTEVD